jgi:hypothetical protein
MKGASVTKIFKKIFIKVICKLVYSMVDHVTLINECKLYKAIELLSEVERNL